MTRPAHMRGPLCVHGSGDTARNARARQWGRTSGGIGAHRAVRRASPVSLKCRERTRLCFPLLGNVPDVLVCEWGLANQYIWDVIKPRFSQTSTSGTLSGFLRAENVPNVLTCYFAGLELSRMY